MHGRQQLTGAYWFVYARHHLIPSGAHGVRARPGARYETSKFFIGITTMAIYLRTSSDASRQVPYHELSAVFDASVPWIDLVNATSEEMKAVEGVLGIEIPTREEMREIESTSRLYCEHGARFMTTPLLVNADNEAPVATEIAFVLYKQHLITLRETNPISFRMTVQQVERGQARNRDGIFIALLENIVDRQADFLERLSHETDDVSQKIFRKFKRARETENNLREAIFTLGRVGNLLARERDNIVSLSRLVQYAGHEDFDSERDGQRTQVFPRLKPIARDIQSLAEFAGFLASKVNFMLDATLGLINIEQNSIVKIFSVAAVIFLPPTLVASIYGMNFQFMPELDKPWGYPFALGLMLLSVLIPFLFCRHKGWL